jgi:hypothetical protein
LIDRPIDMVTQSQLEQLRAQRSAPDPSPALTPGGSLEQQVHTQTHMQREQTIADGERSLHDALEQLRNNYAFASPDGLAQAHFNHVSQEITP